MSSFFDIEALEREAMNRTGLDDFGPGDWRQAMHRLLRSAEEEAQLSKAGRAIVGLQVMNRLVNRLEIEDWIARHPEVREQRVVAPLILATLPRTGQTAAGWIFDRDPANRSLLAWFAKRPVPPPKAGAGEADPRIAQERAQVGAMPQAVLDMHLYDAEEPDECHWLISNGFTIPHEIYSMRVPSYYRWVRDEADMGQAYAYYHLQLQLLQSRDPGRRWVLKNSPHLLHLEQLHAVLPDAIFVQFHRDPLKVLASNCRLAVVLRQLQSDDVDPHEVGVSMLQLLGDYVDRLLRFRSKGVSRPWVDVRFSDFVSDPFRTTAGIYETAGINASEEAKRGMTRWVKENPRQDLSRPRAADLAPYGIDPDDARARFAEYVDLFDVDYDGL
ncbi:MAG: sulfotransferase [Deltaproteobacteria bacterium]|nr:sulfotransferase [Deltaproteobacteria bacterium]